MTSAPFHPGQVMTDFRRTAFPAHMPCGSDALAEVRANPDPNPNPNPNPNSIPNPNPTLTLTSKYFDALNDKGGTGGAGGAGLAGRVAALRAAHPGSPVVSAPLVIIPVFPSYHPHAP